MLAVAVAAAATATVPTVTGYKVVSPDQYKVLRTSGQSTLYSAELPSAHYELGTVKVMSLAGSRKEIGRAYSELLGNETIDTFNRFINHLIPNKLEQDAFLVVADWLWSSFLEPHVPQDFMDELEGMKEASPPGARPSVDAVSRRFNTLANLPADPQNIATMLEQELEKGVSPLIAGAINRVINGLLKCTWCDQNGRLPSSTGCDSFGIWGSRTKGGRLYTSRNLDWAKDTGISNHKLVAILKPDGVAPYATFGYASGLGALAGMSRAGISVSEMNLDNSKTTFDGPPFPLRLRMVMEKATNLAEAKQEWLATNNTDSMNYLIGSGADTSALAVEAIRGFSAFYGADSPTEAAATCIVGTKAGGSCGSAFPNTTTAGKTTMPIGSPLKEAVWRSNHAVHPKIMPTQEPLFNDTYVRYQLLHDLIEGLSKDGAQIADAEAISIAATLGIKGVDFYSCDASRFSKGTNVLSVVYGPTPGAGFAYAAWEDGSKSEWRPAACNTYIFFDFTKFW